MFEKWRKKREKKNMKKQASVLSELCSEKELNLEAIIAESDKMIQIMDRSHF